MSCKSTAMDFAKAKLDQFKSIVNSPEVKGGMPLLEALKKANYRIEKQGSKTHCLKGRAIISFDGQTSDAMVTLVHGSNLSPCH